MKFFITFILIISIVNQSICEKASFLNYKLIRVFPKTNEQLEYVHNLEETDYDVDIWGSVLVGDQKSIDIMLSPTSFAKYSRLFKLKDIEFSVMNENVQDMIDQESKSMVRNKNDRSIIFKYARYSEIMNFIDDTVEENSDIASSSIIGTTDGNRNLKLIKLRSGNPQKAVWIDCGIHAREWVTPASCVYIIHRLIKDFREFDPEITQLFSKYEFNILPILNPDGYEYSHTTYRLWRKNRKVNAGSTCYGVDLNRNFPFKWMSGGASNDPCTEIHAGPSAASEPEAQAVINYVNARKGEWESFLSIHSYGNWWLTPYGHSVDEIAPDQELIMAAANVGVEAINNFNGSVFIAGPSSQLLYVHSGLSPDWAYADMGIRYSHVIELRPGQGTPDYIYGFVLPEDRLPLVTEEIYIGIRAYLYYISQL